MEDNILGFDPSQLSVFNQPESKGGSANSNIYKPQPKLSKSEDQVYRAQIKVIYNPHSLRESIVQRQSYALQDDKGFFQMVSKLTNNDTDCPIFKAWKTCHYSKDPVLQAQALTKDKGGKGLFDKRFERYVTVQILEDNNQPELQGRYMFWKMPRFIWDAINGKMNPSPESKKPSIPVMDFLFGRAIDLEITPGPDDPSQPERKTREISYSTSEITDDVISCTNPDGSPLLTDDEQNVLEQYVEEMTKKVWKQRDPVQREIALAEIQKSENTQKLTAMYRRVLEEIKKFCPNVNEEMGYHEWSDEDKARVQNWIDVVLAGGDPTVKRYDAMNPISATTQQPNPTVTPTPSVDPLAMAAASATDEKDNDDLPF